MKRRAALGSLTEFGIVFGVLIAVIVTLFSSDAPYWRISFSGGGVLSLFCFFGMLFAVETPQYLLMKGVVLGSACNLSIAARFRITYSIRTVLHNILWYIWHASTVSCWTSAIEWFSSPMRSCCQPTKKKRGKRSGDTTEYKIGGQISIS